MAGLRLTDKAVRDLARPPRGNVIAYDAELKGFGLRTTAAGAKAFVLGYTIAGRERRLTIGSYPAWSVLAARDEAKRLRRLIDTGKDPLAEREATRAAPTVDELCDRYLAEHAIKKRTGEGDRKMIERHVRPRFGARKVEDIGFSDIDRMHREIGKTAPYVANRVVALASKMFSLAIRWKMRTDNPAKGVERNTETKRKRYLKPTEMVQLTEALAGHPNQAANVVRLLLLTGARRGEVLKATWDQFDLEAGNWTKPAANTKQELEHTVPLSAPARQLLADIKAAAERQAKEKDRLPSRYVFPARGVAGPVADIKGSWAAICKAAGLEGVRLHDLRHSYASILVSAGLSLPIIGALLGHTQTSTTARYAHLFDDPLRAATERVGAIVMGGKPGAEVVPLARHRE